MSNDNKDTDLENEKKKLEVENLREEIKKTRRENRLWIIGLLLAVAGFGLGNLKTIQSLVIREPRVRLIVEDPFVKRVGMVRIVNTSGSRNIVVATAVSEAEEWLTLTPGSYAVEITVEDRVFYSRQVLLKGGDSEPIIVPERETGSIRILVKNHTPNPKPDAPLDLSIESSGNGFLWVFDFSDDGKYSQVYPDLKTPNAVAAIRAGETYKIPDAKGVNILTNENVGQERLLFIVTSAPLSEEAQKIATRMSKAVIAKASTGREKTNWGIASLQYNVSL